MKKSLALFLLLLFALAGQAQKKVNVQAQMQLAMQQYSQMLSAHKDTTQTPQSFADGHYIDMPADWWCSGFFGSSLWYLYQYSHLPKWKDAASLWTLAVQKEQFNTSTHDLGFMIYGPFGNGYRLTGNPQYKKVLLQGAKSL